MQTNKNLRFLSSDQYVCDLCKSNNRYFVCLALDSPSNCIVIICFKCNLLINKEMSAGLKIESNNKLKEIESVFHPGTH